MKRSVLRICIIFFLFYSKESFCSCNLCKKDLDSDYVYKYEEGIFSIKRATDGTFISENLLKECSNLQSEENDGEPFFTLSTHRENVLMEINKGKDGRIPVQNPEKSTFRYHAFLDLKFPENNFRGTGTLVGPRHILTAGHNVFGPNWVNQIDVFLSLDGSKKPFGKQRVIQVYTYPQWVDHLNRSYDIALLILDNPIGLTMGWLSMKALLVPLDGIDITIAGYPGLVSEDKVEEPHQEEARRTGANYKKMWMMSGPMTSFLSNRIGYQLDTSEGQSGSAIFYCDQEGTIYVIGVHTHGLDDKTVDSQNTGTRITESVIKDFSTIIAKTSVVRKVGPLILFNFLEMIKMLRLIHPKLCLMELQMPVSMVDQQTQTYGDGQHHHMEIRVEKFEELCSLDKFRGDETALYIKYVLEKCFHRTLFIDYICDPDVAIKIEHLFFKKNKTLEDIIELTKYFCWEKGTLLPILNEEHNSGKMRDESFYDHIRTYQIVLLWILSEAHKINYQRERQDILLSEDAERMFKIHKKSLIENMIESYKKGACLLDKARRFWRDDHKNVGTTCYSAVGVLKPTFYQERYVENGTQSYLTALYTQLHEHYLVVVQGSGGIGKSTLVAQYVDEAKKNNAYDLICWMNAENEDTLRNSFLDIIRKIEAKKKELNPSYVPSSKIDISNSIIEMKEHIETIMYSFIKSPLFIFDNAPKCERCSPLKDNDSYDNIYPYLPVCKHTLITTRMDPGEYVPSLSVDVFSDQEAIDYIKARLKLSDDDTQHAKDLAQKLGNHPLALSVACGYIKDDEMCEDGDLSSETEGMNISIFLEKYEGLFSQFAEYHPKDGISKSLYITLQMSIDKLKDGEKDMFYKLCYLSPDFIPIKIFGFYGQSKKLFNTLKKTSLINITKNDKNIITSLSLHRLTQEVGRYIFEQGSSVSLSCLFKSMYRSCVDYHLSLKKKISQNERSVPTDLIDQLRVYIQSLSSLVHHSDRLTLTSFDSLNVLARSLIHQLTADSIKDQNDDKMIQKTLELTDEDYVSIKNSVDTHLSELQQEKRFYVFNMMRKIIPENREPFLIQISESLEKPLLYKNIEQILSTYLFCQKSQKENAFKSACTFFKLKIGLPREGDITFDHFRALLLRSLRPGITNFSVLLKLVQTITSIEILDSLAEKITNHICCFPILTVIEKTNMDYHIFLLLESVKDQLMGMYFFNIFTPVMTSENSIKNVYDTFLTFSRNFSSQNAKEWTEKDNQKHYLIKCGVTKLLHMQDVLGSEYLRFAVFFAPYKMALPDLFDRAIEDIDWSNKSLIMVKIANKLEFLKMNETDQTHFMQKARELYGGKWDLIPQDLQAYCIKAIKDIEKTENADEKKEFMVQLLSTASCPQDIFSSMKIVEKISSKAYRKAVELFLSSLEKTDSGKISDADKNIVLSALAEAIQDQQDQSFEKEWTVFAEKGIPYVMNRFLHFSLTDRAIILFNLLYRAQNGMNLECFLDRLDPFIHHITNKDLFLVLQNLDQIPEERFQECLLEQSIMNDMFDYQGMFDHAIDMKDDEWAVFFRQRIKKFENCIWGDITQEKIEKGLDIIHSKRKIYTPSVIGERIILSA